MIDIQRMETVRLRGLEGEIELKKENRLPRAFNQVTVESYASAEVSIILIHLLYNPECSLSLSEYWWYSDISRIVADAIWRMRRCMNCCCDYFAKPVLVTTCGLIPESIF